MPNQIARERPPSLETAEILLTTQHDTRAITPLHVSVIRAISAVIDVDPEESCLELSEYISIAALDSICDYREGGFPQKCGLGFYYGGHGSNLLVVARSTGQILIYDGDTVYDDCGNSTSE